MRTTRIILSLLFVLQLPAAAYAANAIRFKGRTLDLDAYLQGFPYLTPFVDLRSGHLFYKKRGKTDQLMMLAFDPASTAKVDLDKGTVISPRDFSKRNLWGVFYSRRTDKVIIEADENNDEVLNFYELDPKTGDERKLSTTAYIFGWTLDEDGGRVAFSTRSGKDEMSPGDVRILDLVTGKETVVFKDSPETKLVWGSLTWQPGDRGLLVSVIAASDRSRRNLLYIPLGAGQAPRTLTDAKVKRSELDPLNLWLNADEYLYTSNESDHNGIYRASLKGGAPVLITPKEDNVKDAAVFKNADGSLQAAAIIGNPLKSTLKMIDPASGEVWSARTFDEHWSLADIYGDKAAVDAFSLSVPFKITELHLSGKKLESFERAAYPDALLKKIINCDPEKVSYETFDKLSAPGEHGTLHAYLLKPKKPRQGDEARALVLSFYGGANAYSTTFQLLCDAGYYVLSPAPRGTTEFGAAFYDLAEGDWGGGETLDDLYAGKYLVSRLGVPAKHVGIYGGSRGGYDALRALTFPGEVDGVKESFRFGFGISDFGVGDIIRAGKGGNISQWYAYLTGGDPMKNEAKWVDRSPETHADLISGPVLLTHGTNDHRIPVTESRLMYAKLKSLGKEAYLVEMPGQGHGYKGIEALRDYYRAYFDFLDKIK